MEYALKSHRRDGFIEWIKGLLAVPFVLHGDLTHANASTITTPAKEYEADLESRLRSVSKECQRRYLEVFEDIEKLIESHTRSEQAAGVSRLRKLVPSVGSFYTPLPLGRIAGDRRHIVHGFLSHINGRLRPWLLYSAELLKMLYHATIPTFIALFASFGASANSCRQCSGSVTVNIDKREPDYIISTWFQQTVGDCAGTDFSLTDLQLTNCDPVQHNLCRTYAYRLQAWRFCANGGAAKFGKTYLVIFTDLKDNVTMLYDLICTHSVNCKGHICANCFPDKPV